ncbi:MAG: hypothetical protein U0354_09385 [Candidatus Sericytochromatia bacterium]
MTDFGVSNSKVVGKADTLAEARALARNNEGNEVIREKRVGLFDKEYIVEKLDSKDVDQSKQKLKSKFDPSIVEFSQDKEGKEIFVANTSDSFRDSITNIYNKARNETENLSETAEKVVDKVVEKGKEIFIGASTPKPTDGTIVKNNIGPEIINDFKSDKIKLPIYVEIKNKETGKLSYLKLDQKVIDSLKEVEFPKDAQKRYGFTDTQDTKDKTITKAYGCTDTKLHKYLVAGKDAKAEKAAEAVLIYQAITHTDRFDSMPKPFLDNLNNNQKVGFLSAAFNMSKGMFVGGTKDNPDSDSPNGFEPVKMLKNYWNELTQGDGKLSLNDVNDAINRALGFSISGGVKPTQSGLYSRRAFDFIISMGHDPKVSSPYGQEKVLAETLMDMLKNEPDSSKKDAIKQVIDELKNVPKWAKFFV